MVTGKATNDSAKTTLAERYRLQQAEKMIALFTKARGRGPNNIKELAAFLDAEVKAGRLPPGSIDPCSTIG